MKNYKTPKSIIDKIIELHLQGYTSRNICDTLGWKHSKKSTVNFIIADWKAGKIDYSKDEKSLKSHLPKVLVLDVETAPMRSYIFSMWKPHVALNMIDTDWFLLSFAAKWLGSPVDEVIYDDMRGKVSTEDDTHLLDQLWKLLDEADIVLTQNGKWFDLPKIKARMVLNGYKPFSPIKHLDTLQIAKKEFGFTSNKLEYMTDKLCVKYKKQKHGKFAGFDLWAEMMKDNLEAFEECETYNIYDILSLEELYFVISAWDSTHVNFNLYTDSEEVVCRCGSKSLKADGYAYTGAGKFTRFRCLDCGAFTRDRVNQFSKEKRKSLHVNISQ